MRLRCFYGALLFVTLFCLPAAHAQAQFDLNMGFGFAHDASNGQGIEGVNSLYALSSCSLAAPPDQYCEATSALNNFLLGFGMNILLTKRFGVGGDVTFTPERPNYGPLEFRQTFYDFNGIFVPLNTKRAQLQIEGGIGGAHTSFAINESGCISTVVCSTEVEPIGTANHFAVHVAVGVEFFVTDHWFIRPQFDFHYVPNFNTIFNSNAVPGAMVWAGYSWH